MPALDRRVQVLFDPAQYSALEAEAAEQKQSVASIIRESVDDRLKRSKVSRRDAARRLLASAEANRDETPVDWAEAKAAFEHENDSRLG